MSGRAGEDLRAICPVCGRPIIWHDEQTARWCYKAWLARDAIRGLRDVRREAELEVRWKFQ